MINLHKNVPDLLCAFGCIKIGLLNQFDFWLGIFCIVGGLAGRGQDVKTFEIIAFNLKQQPKQAKNKYLFSGNNKTSNIQGELNDALNNYKALNNILNIESANIMGIIL